MSTQTKKNSPDSKTIAFNRKALHEYTVEQRYEAGMVLAGWEIKSIRAGKIQITESYVLLKKGEAWLIGAHISPLLSASSHVNPDATRTDALPSLTMVPNDSLDDFFAATVEATEESIVNAMVAARDMTGADDHFVQALPHERLREVLARYNRLTK